MNAVSVSSIMLICDYFFKLILNNRQLILEDCIFEDMYYVAGLTYKLSNMTGNYFITSNLQYQN
jgi:hypothetical protein